MTMSRCSALACLILPLAACATVPPQQVVVSGTLPGGPYAVVQPDKDAPAPPALDGIEACLRTAGLAPGKPATTLVQVSHAVRPAPSAVLRAGEEPPRARAPRRRDREELTLALTDRVSGELRWRGSVQTVLGKRASAGDGTALVAPLCAALQRGITPGPAAAPR
jgi:hypothetical protein